MKVDWPSSTNKGTALLRLIHQFDTPLLIRDSYIGWFFDQQTIESAREALQPEGIGITTAGLQRNQIAYSFTILRERQFDDVIVEAIANGCRQLLLIGAGFDTRFFRLPDIQQNAVRTFEVDLPGTIHEKTETIAKRLGSVPEGLTFVPLDLRKQGLTDISTAGFDPGTPAVYVWQGVSYYLDEGSVRNVVRSVASMMTPSSVFAFDGCAPTMIHGRGAPSWINENIERMCAIGEPFLFGIEANEMTAWLRSLGLVHVSSFQPDELEYKYLGKKTLPGDSWYTVVALK
jgi:methyltransferase (TIGR00027 family)